VTGIRPDEVNWVAGRDPEDRTRQICNGWKADPAIAGQVLAERTGQLASLLMGWDGVRILQDNCIWKPPGTKSLGMHQDGLSRLPRSTPDDHLLDRGPNTATVHRRAVISHLIPEATEFDPVKADPVYSRYRKAGDMRMDESYFPVVRSRSGGRSAWLDAELAQDLGSVLAEPGHRS
jgi:hypothetical protein